jgi:hypothetical protein
MIETAVRVALLAKQKFIKTKGQRKKRGKFYRNTELVPVPPPLPKKVLTPQINIGLHSSTTTTKMKINTFNLHFIHLNISFSLS